MAVYAITQARIGSQRLPGKVLEPICGRPLLDYHLTRLSQITGLARVIVATADNDENRPLHDYLDARQFDYIKGSEEDVLARFYQATSELQPDDIILRVTADCPLLCPELITDMLESYQQSEVNYLRLDTDHVARGFDAELLRVWMLREAHETTDSDYDREHVTPYFYKAGSTYTTSVFRPEIPASNQFRLCVDEAADLLVIEKIIEAYRDTWQSLDYLLLVDYLARHPEVVAINQDVTQRNSS